MVEYLRKSQCANSYTISISVTILIGLTLLLAPAATILAQTATPVPVLTWRYDITHAGENTQETLLSPSNVNANSFGKLFSLPVDGEVFAQPLYVPNLKMSDGLVHNVLFVATENDSIYAFDADSNSGANADPIWHISLLTSAYGAGAGATPVPWQDTGSPDVAPVIGITGTPAIDLTTDTMYVVAATKENGVYYSRLHAINIITGAEQPGSPVNITATVAGTGLGSSGGELTFSPMWENQRPALDFYNGYVYIGYAAHGDNGDYHGWLFAYDATTLKQTAALCLTPNTYGAGVWGAGAGMPIDNDATGGRMFVTTGNGDTSSYPPFSSDTEFGESVIDFSLANGGLTPTDAFTAYNYQTLNDHDWDLGSGGALLLPDQQGAYPHILIAGGKEGRVLVLNRDKLGGYPASGATSDPNALQEITGLTPQGEGYWNTAAYWNGNVYIWPENGSPMLFNISNGVMNTQPSGEDTGVTSAFPSPSFSISSDGTQDGVAWAVRSDQFNTNGPAVLYAWDANNLTTPIYESDTNSARDSAGPANKFSVPVVTDGKVYVAANGEVDVYGLLSGQPQADAPAISPDGGTFTTPQTVTLSTSTASAQIYYTLDGSTPTTASTLYAGPITVSYDSTLNAIASAPGYIESVVSSATFNFSNETPPPTFSPAAGTYLTAQNVTITDADANAKIYYTTDGSTPSSSSTLYTGQVTVSTSEALSVIAIDPTKQSSNVVTAAYVIQEGGSTIDFSNGFSSPQGLTFNGSAVAQDDTRLQLTNGGLSQAGSVFWSAPIGIQAFTTNFEFQLSDAQGNGFTFTIQNMGPRALGGDSAGLGYQDIQNSVAIKFNFYNYQNEGDDSTGVYTDGEPPVTPTVDISPSGIELNSGDSIQAQVTYDGTTLTLNLHDLVTNDTFTMSQQINIPQIVGADSAYVGFTGGTGGLTASQKILTWTYTAKPGPQPGSPEFSLSSSPASDISLGTSTTTTISITPGGGFTGSVNLACAVTGGPSGSSNPPACSVSQPAAITGSQPVTATLTISTSKGTSAALHNPFTRLLQFGGGGTLTALLFFWLPLRRRKWCSLLGVLLLAGVAMVATGCGGGYKLSTSSSGASSGTTPGQYTITVSGTSGSMVQSVAVQVTVQ
jgi:Legume lectin domain/Chitobiase/beta-hexosaminidase C-terminal domain